MLNDLNNPKTDRIECSNLHLQQIKPPKQSQLYMQNLKKLSVDLQTPYEQRSILLSNTIYNTIRKVNLFAHIQTLSSPQLLKNLIKHGKILSYKENQLISKKDSPIDNIIITLYGTFASINKNPIQHIELSAQESYTQFYEKLKSFSPSYLQLLKKKQHQKQPKLSYSQKTFNFTSGSLQNATIFYSDHQIQHVLIANSFNNNMTQLQRHNQTIVTQAKENFVFSLNFRKMCELLTEQYNKTLNQQISIFLNFDCFKLFKKQKLRQIVEATEIIRLRKGDFLFKQGQKDDRIFILRQGEIVLQKTVNLNTQNPNELYHSRLYLKRQSHSQNIKQKIQTIPFADFSKLFNSSSTKKKVKITRISSVSLFGEEQLIYKKSIRQTSAHVTSPWVELYVIYLTKMQKFIPTASNFTITTFLKVLKQQITNKKILYRQQKFGSDIMNLQKTTQNKFFINKSKPKMSSLQKRNKTLNLNSPQQKSSKSKCNDDFQQQLNNSEFITAAFTCHNFYEFYQESYQKQKKQLQKNVIQKQKQINPEQSRVKYSNEQKEVIKLLHRNIGQSKNKFSNPSSFKINLQYPLFSAQYFNQQRQKSLKLDKNLKKQKLKSLYKNSTLSPFQGNKRFKTLSTSFLSNSAYQKKSYKRNLSSQK